MRRLSVVQWNALSALCRWERTKNQPTNHDYWTWRGITLVSSGSRLTKTGEVLRDAGLVTASGLHTFRCASIESTEAGRLVYEQELAKR